MPGRIMSKENWLSRPGVESILIPKDGTVQAWMTSIDVERTRIWSWKGSTHRLSTSNSRNSLISRVSVGIIKESNSIFLNSVYSYVQNHWWPIVLIVILGWGVESKI